MLAAISRTRWRVSSEIMGLPESDRDTVERDTPARRATLAMSFGTSFFLRVRFIPRLPRAAGQDSTHDPHCTQTTAPRLQTFALPRRVAKCRIQAIEAAPFVSGR